MKIKKIREDNWEMFKEIRLEAFRNEPVAFATPIEKAENWGDDYWISMVSNNDNIIIIAEEDGKAIGIARAALKDEDVEEGIAFVGSVYVNKEYRGKGVAKELMGKLEHEVREYKEMKGMRLWVNKEQGSAIQLYKGLNFDFVGVDKDELIMEKLFL